MDTVLTARGVRKRFGATQALDGASVELRRGEWLALLGPNGAGKTTLIRAISGRVRPDDGEITLLGERLGTNRLKTGSTDHRLETGATDSTHATNGASARDRLGVVPQGIALYPYLTAAENLRAFGELQGLRGAALRERVDWALTWTALTERAREPVRNYSGGMKRRLNIGCGVLHKPEVVLLDEPTVGVDPQSRERIWEMLEGLRKDGASLLLTTHQLDEAQKVCDRIVIIDHGRDIARGTLTELIAQTVGPARRVTLTLDRPPLPCQLGENAGDDAMTVEGNRVQCRVKDVAGELPPLLARIHDVGLRVDDVQVEAPSLHAVFLHLTGKELRE